MITNVSKIKDKTVDLKKTLRGSASQSKSGIYYTGCNLISSKPSPSHGSAERLQRSESSKAKQVSHSLLSCTAASRQRANQSAKPRPSKSEKTEKKTFDSKKKRVVNEELIRRAQQMYQRELERLQILAERRKTAQDSKEELELLNCSFQPKLNHHSNVGDIKK